VHIIKHSPSLKYLPRCSTDANPGVHSHQRAIQHAQQDGSSQPRGDAQHPSSEIHKRVSPDAELKASPQAGPFCQQSPGHARDATLSSPFSDIHGANLTAEQGPIAHKRPSAISHLARNDAGAAAAAAEYSLRDHTAIAAGNTETSSPAASASATISATSDVIHDNQNQQLAGQQEAACPLYVLFAIDGTWQEAKEIYKVPVPCCNAAATSTHRPPTTPTCFWKHVPSRLGIHTFLCVMPTMKACLHPLEIINCVSCCWHNMQTS